MTERMSANGHSDAVLWLTGLSGSGKSTRSSALERILFDSGCSVAVLDGDQMRKGLCSDLSYSLQDRSENLRRVSNVARCISDLGFLCLAATISPLWKDRLMVHALLEPGRFHEVYIKADLQTCERRDVKGLYKRARSGYIQDFTGIQSQY